MKLMLKMVLCFVSVVLVFGVVMIVLNFQSVEREKQNTTKMYEERGVAIASSIDAGVTSIPQLNTYAQTMVNRATANKELGIVEFSIHGQAPEGQTETGYWRIASSNSELMHTASDPEDIQAIQEDEYNILYDVEDGVKILDITYPLHDMSGKAIATAGIKLDMSAVDKLMVPSTTYIYIVIMLIIALGVSLYLAYTVTKPIKQLTDVANNISTGKLDVTMPNIKSKDEIGDLAKSFSRMVASIKFMMTDKEG